MEKQDCFGNEIKLGSLVAIGQHYAAEMEIGVVIGFSNKGVHHITMKHTYSGPMVRARQDTYQTNSYSKNGWRKPSKNHHIGTINARIIVLPTDYLNDAELKMYKSIKEDHDLL